MAEAIKCLQNVVKLGCEDYGTCVIPPKPPIGGGKFEGYGDIDDIKHIHHSIPQQFATYLGNDYNKLVDFIKEYWRWAELPRKPYFDLKNHLGMLNFEYQVFEYLEQMKKEYLFGFPSELALRQVLDILIRYSRDIHLNGGTEAYVKFLYNLSKQKRGQDTNEVEIKYYYPSYDMLRCSWGKWNNGDTILFTSSMHDASGAKYRKVTQSFIQLGKEVHVSAIISKIEPFVTAIYKGYRILLEDMVGTFDSNFPLMVGDNVEYLYPINNEPVITDRGSGYSLSNRIIYSGRKSFTTMREAQVGGIIQLGFDGIFNKSQVSIKDANNIPLTDYSLSQGVIKSDKIVPYSWYYIEMPSDVGSARIAQIDSVGGIMRILFDTPSIGCDSRYNIVDNVLGRQATVNFAVASVYVSGGYFRNHDGWLSDKDVLQDSYFYQEFSKEIKIFVGENTSPSSVSISDLDKTAGNIVFRHIVTMSLGCFMNNALGADGYELEQKGSYSEVSENRLFARYYEIENLKYRYNPETVRVQSFQDVKPYEEIFQTPFMHFNTHDSIVLINGWEVRERYEYDANNQMHSDYGYIDDSKLNFGNEAAFSVSLPTVDFSDLSPILDVTNRHDKAYNIHDDMIKIERK